MNALRRSLTSCSVLNRIHFDKQIYSGVRYLFNEQYLGIDKFSDGQVLTRKQYGNMKDNFLLRMKQQLEGSGSMIFTEDLKTVIHLVDDKPEELELCTKMIRKFHGQNKELRFGTFIFGPVVMRLLHHIRKADLVLDLIKDEVVSDFFAQIRSYVIAMDLLFEQGYYEEVIELGKTLVTKQLMDTKYPRDCIVLISASCYKLNTPDSLKIATELVTEARQAGATISQKTIYLISALAINQNSADIAMEILSSLNFNNNLIANNLKLMALSKLDRIQDAFNILERKLEQDVPSQTFVRGDICQSALDVLKEAIDRANDTELTHEFENLCRALSDSNAITVQTIDGLLSEPIAPRPFVDGPFGVRDQNVRRSSFGRRDEPFFRREGAFPPRRQAYGSGISDE